MDEFLNTCLKLLVSSPPRSRLSNVVADGQIKAAAFADDALTQLFKQRDAIAKTFIDKVMKVTAPAQQDKHEQFGFYFSLLAHVDRVQALEDVQERAEALESYILTAAEQRPPQDEQELQGVEALRSVVEEIQGMYEADADGPEGAALGAMLEVFQGVLAEVDADKVAHLPRSAFFSEAASYLKLARREGDKPGLKCFAKKAQALQALGVIYCQMDPSRSVATRKQVMVAQDVPAAVRQQMAQMGAGPPVKPTFANVHITRDFDLWRVLDVSTIHKELLELLAMGHKLRQRADLPAEGSAGGSEAEGLATEVAEGLGLEFLVYLRLVRQLGSVISSSHKDEDALHKLATLVSTGVYPSGQLSRLHPSRLRQLALEALQQLDAGLAASTSPATAQMKEVAAAFRSAVVNPSTYLAQQPAGSDASGPERPGDWDLEVLKEANVLEELQTELMVCFGNPPAAREALTDIKQALSLFCSDKARKGPGEGGHLDAKTIAADAMRHQTAANVRHLALVQGLKSLGNSSDAMDKYKQMYQILRVLPHKDLMFPEGGEPKDNKDRGQRDLKLAVFYRHIRDCLRKGMSGRAGAKYLGEFLQALLGEAPLSDYPQQVQKGAFEAVALLLNAMTLREPAMSGLPVVAVVAAACKEEQPWDSTIRNALLGVLSIEDPESRLSALEELSTMLAGVAAGNVALETFAPPPGSPGRGFDLLAAAADLVCAAAAVAAELRRLPAEALGADAATRAAADLQAAWLKAHSLQDVGPQAEKTQDPLGVVQEAGMDLAASVASGGAGPGARREFAEKASGALRMLPAQYEAFIKACLQGLSLHDTAAREHLAELLATTASPNYCLPAPHGMTLLHLAARCDAREVAKLLVEAGADTTARTYELQALRSSVNRDSVVVLTPLDLAALRGSWGVVEVLLAAGASTAADPATGLTPLHFAAAVPSPLTPQGLFQFDARKVAVVKLLHKHRANSNAATAIHGMTPLHTAAWANLPRTAKELLHCGARAKAVDKRGLNVLHYAAMHRGPVSGVLVQSTRDLIQLFLSKGVSADQGPMLDDPRLCNQELESLHHQLPRSVQILRKFGAPDGMLASTVILPTMSSAALLYDRVILAVAQLAASRRHPKQPDTTIWWDSQSPVLLANFRRRAQLMLAPGFKHKLTPYRLALLNERWDLAELLQAACPRAAKLAPLPADVDFRECAVGGVLRPCTTVENAHGFRYLLTQESQDAAQTDRRLQMVGVSSRIKQEGLLLFAPMLSNWDKEAVDWQKGPPGDESAEMQQRLDQRHIKAVKLQGRDHPKYNTANGALVRFVDIHAVDGRAPELASYGHALMTTLRAF